MPLHLVSKMKELALVQLPQHTQTHLPGEDEACRPSGSVPIAGPTLCCTDCVSPLQEWNHAPCSLLCARAQGKQPLGLAAPRPTLPAPEILSEEKKHAVRGSLSINQLYNPPGKKGFAPCRSGSQ